ncbi:MAG: InlB B-repeat-containing protein, partial [Planctomycetota bacterium]
MTFDDGLRSQFENAFPLLQEYGLKATFFIYIDDLDQGYGDYMDPNDILALAQDGHEIGSHSYSHPFLTLLDFWEQDAELYYSQAVLQDLTGQDIATIAYPYGDYDANVMDLTREYYIAARSTDTSDDNSPDGLNASSPDPNEFYRLLITEPYPYDVGDQTVDPNAVDPNAVEHLQYRIDKAVTEQKWLIEMLHGINSGWDAISEATLETHLNYLMANEPNVWVAPMGTISEYIYERDDASVTLVYSDSNLIRLDLSCQDLKNDIRTAFLTPLTLLSPCPDGWESGVILVKQGQMEEIVGVVSKNGDLYMIYNALPDAGMIELFPASYTITASAGSNGTIDQSGDFNVNYGDDQLFTATPDIGYEVDTWIVDSNEVHAGATTYLLSNITADHTVSVTFKLQTYTITASAVSNGAIDPNGLVSATYGSDQLFTATPEIGYKVDTWFVDSNEVQTGGTTYLLSDVTGDQTVLVIFKRIPVTISGQILNPVGASLPGVMLRADNGGGQAFTDPNGHYELVVDYGWSGIVEPNAVGYVFDPNTLNYVNVVSDTAGDYTVRHIADLVPDGFIDGYDLQVFCQRWLAEVLPSDDIDVDGRMNLKDFSILAEHWLHEYGNYDLVSHSITASAGSDGSIVPSGILIVDHRASQLFTATPDTGYEVDEWSVDGALVQPGGMEFTLTNITADQTVSVTFKPLTFTVDYTAGTGGTLTGETAQVVNYGADANEVTAVPDTGYSFVDWSDGSTDNPRTDLNVTANITVTANFTIDTFTVDYTAGAGGTLTGETAQVVA